MSFLITSKKEITEYELTYFVKMNSIDIKKDIYNFINRGFGNEEEINNASPRRVVIVNRKAFPLEYPPSPEDVIWMDLEATKSSKIIDKLLANNGFLIIINCGENFITAYMKKYIGNGYYFIESLEDEYENEALEESPNLRAIKNIYGSVMKYYIFMKNVEMEEDEIAKEFIQINNKTQLSEIKNQYKVNPLKDLIPVCANCHTARWNL